MSREQLLASTFVELADTLTDDFDVLDFLQRLVTRSAELLGADAASLILVDQRGDLQPIASTTHAVEVLGLVTIATDQGPCLDAFHAGVPVVNVPAPEAARRWPGFTQNAAELGFHTAQVVPLTLRGTVLGALTLLFGEVSTLDDSDLAVAQALASVTTIGLLQERTSRQKEILAEQLQTALTQRVTIEQAKGVVAELAGIGVPEAFDLILIHSRGHGRTLSAVAGEVIAGTLDLASLRSSPPDGQ
jgi:transcriptional regulator with GAF, ATPase, and Fis domain